MSQEIREKHEMVGTKGGFLSFAFQMTTEYDVKSIRAETIFSVMSDRSSFLPTVDDFYQELRRGLFRRRFCSTAGFFLAIELAARPISVFPTPGFHNPTVPSLYSQFYPGSIQAVFMTSDNGLFIAIAWLLSGPVLYTYLDWQGRQFTSPRQWFLWRSLPFWCWVE